jgi:hypothetical protein
VDACGADRGHRTFGPGGRGGRPPLYEGAPAKPTQHARWHVFPANATHSPRARRALSLAARMVVSTFGPGLGHSDQREFVGSTRRRPDRTATVSCRAPRNLELIIDPRRATAQCQPSVLAARRLGQRRPPVRPGRPGAAPPSAHAPPLASGDAVIRAWADRALTRRPRQAPGCDPEAAPFRATQERDGVGHWWSEPPRPS